MSWSYLADFTTTRDQLRMLIGDTEPIQQLLQDEELDWISSLQPDRYLAAADACEAIAAKFAKRVTVSIAGQSADLNQKLVNYRELADRLRVESGRHGGAGAVTVGALVVLESRSLEAAAGVSPAFHRAQFGYPGAEP